MERVLADIDADYGDFTVNYLGHGVLLIFGAPGQFPSMAGQEHARTIPLAVIATGIQDGDRAMIPDKQDEMGEEQAELSRSLG